MDEIRLVAPSLRYADQLMAYRSLFTASGEDCGGSSGLLAYDNLPDWLAYVQAMADPATCPEHLVPSDVYLAVRTSDDRLVGMIDLRHHIDHPILSVWGGHIGYSVHPEERRKGYATRMLQMDLDKARQLGLRRVLITCNEGNLGSEGTILKNGGVYEKSVDGDGRVFKRFWIEL